MIDSTTTSAPAGFALAASEGEILWWESQLFTIKCSTMGLGLVEGNRRDAAYVVEELQLCLPPERGRAPA